MILHFSCGLYMALERIDVVEYHNSHIIATNKSQEAQNVVA